VLYWVVLRGVALWGGARVCVCCAVLVCVYVLMKMLELEMSRLRQVNRRACNYPFRRLACPT